MVTLPFELVDDHVILRVAGLVALLDTGAARSFGRAPLVALPWSATPAALPPRSPAGRAIEEVSDALRAFGGQAAAAVDLDLLIGCDVLGGLRVVLEWGRREVQLEPRPDDATPARMHHGIPVCDLEVDLRRVDAFVDSGARLSYVRPSVVPHATPHATHADFNFLAGPREDCSVPVVECVVGLDGHHFRAPIGLAVRSVESALASVGVAAILGVDLMRRTGRTVIDLP